MITRLNVTTSSELSDWAPGLLYLRWTKHAREQAARRGIPIESSLFAGSRSVVKVEYGDGIRGNQLQRVVIRLHLDESRDRVLVLSPDGTEAVVITCWTKLKSDIHRTLNLTRLDQLAGGFK